MPARVYPTPSTTTYWIRQGTGGAEYKIDDIYRVDFQRRVNHQPIYGYNSKQFDFVAQGKELVSGNLVINFRYPAYLYNLMAVAKVEAKISADATRKAIYREPSMMDFDPGNVYETIQSMPTTPDKLSYLANILVTAGAGSSVGGPAYMAGQDYYSSIGGMQHTPALAEPGAFPGNYNVKNQMRLANMVKNLYRSKFSSREEHPNEHIARHDLLSIGSKFDIVVKYSHVHSRISKGSLSSTFTRVFKDCHLVGEEETVSASAGVGNDLSSSAQPILEIYPFFCKTVYTEPRK